MDAKVIKEDTVRNAGNLENGTYEVLKARLNKHGEDFKTRIEKLNTARKEVFGSIDTKLLGNERIITEHNCIPRDMVPVDTSFIFGYNVHIGLKSKVELEDVFSIYEYKDHAFKQLPLTLIQDKQFQDDFCELYKYYKNTFFAKFTVIEPYLYMIFQTGKSATDIKAFKWLMEEGRLTYADSRSDHEVRFQNHYEFQWLRAGRDDQRSGKHPHISILDKVFVETLEGDLTIKIENNTDTGKGIYSESVEDKDQSLDDAEIYYSSLGQLVLLKIRPYKENNYRFFVFNDKLKNVVRIDSIENACMPLPGNHGLIFPDGYYLVSGDYKIFDVPADKPIYEKTVSSSNGEDYQYFFYNIESGIYLIYSYNMIEQTIDTPIVCNGYSHFQNGEMIVFKHDKDPRKNHMLQIWQTPYVGKNYVYDKQDDSILFKIGNKDIVRCMADCKVVYNLIQKGESYQSIYADIVKESNHILDSYFWLDKEETFNLKEVIGLIKDTSAFAIAEYEKVTRIQKATKDQIEEVEKASKALIKEIEFGNYSSISEYVKVLTSLRNLRGRIVTLKDLRYTNLVLIDSLEQSIKEKSDGFSKKCVDFLLQSEGLKPYLERVNELQGKTDKIEKTLDGKALSDDMDATSSEFELLIDIVSNFKIDDPTKTTEIIENISSIYALLNQAKAQLKKIIEKLSEKEMTSQFASQMKLLNQAVVNYLDISNTEDKCDDYLNKVMVQIQELEGKFADFPPYVLELAEKRDELYNAFESKRQLLINSRNKKLLSLFQAAERIIKGIESRIKNFGTVEELNGYYASDIMVEKVRSIEEELNTLGDSVKADELSARIKTIKEEALRQLKDKQELFSGGKDIIQMGKYLFSVNTKPIDLTMINRDNEMYFHISGTDFWEKVEDKSITDYRHVWEQNLPSESKEVYRAEYLAYKLFEAAQNKIFQTIDSLLASSDNQLVSLIQKFMEPRYQEGYTKGVHDVDCMKILRSLLELHNRIDLLIYNPQARAIAQLFWDRQVDSNTKEVIRTRLKELSKISKYFSSKPALSNYIPLITYRMEEALSSISYLDKSSIPQAAEYLCMELMRGDEFVISLEAQEIYEGFIGYLKEKNAYTEFSQSIKASANDMEGLFYLIQEWLYAYNTEASHKEIDEVIHELVVMLIKDSYSRERVIKSKTGLTVTGLVGNHPSIKDGEYKLSYLQFIQKIKDYDQNTAKDFQRFQELKKELLDKCKNELRLEEYKPGVLSSFVRNQLIDKVYLPLIGANLAKQIGVAGENKRTDLMGMLLLISPPGYGKTTLMEYVASRLGLILVKVNGPALGNEVTSLDPDKAPNQGAEEELRKLNLALKLGNNVMIYVDDIQHCNPEFLQKFISLCDGQRKIEGVYKGTAQTFDLRGKKVAVVMAGNPYTESGELFKIPDMLSNRADVYNLGDMLRENEDAFKLSYIENSLTSNSVLNKLSNRSRKDFYSLIQMAKGIDRDNLSFEQDYSVDELNEYISVLQKLFRVRDIVLKVNMEYISSAAKANEYRNEPPFKLQGSYRNMNRIAEKIVSAMNEDELFGQIQSCYENDAQTLTTGAEANLLKWKELVGHISEAETKRWEEIKGIFIKNKLVKSDDKVGQAVVSLSSLNENLEQIKNILAKAGS